MFAADMTVMGELAALKASQIKNMNSGNPPFIYTLSSDISMNFLTLLYGTNEYIHIFYMVG